jgi:hypothetical protein
MAARKSNQVEFNQRVEGVRTMLLRGDSAASICRNVSSTLGISERQVARYMRVAREEILGDAKANREWMMAEHMSVRRAIRKGAIEAGDFRSALAQDEAKLFDLYPATQMSLKVDWRERARAAGYDPDELQRGLIDTLRARDASVLAGHAIASTVGDTAADDDADPAAMASSDDAE